MGGVYIPESLHEVQVGFGGGAIREEELDGFLRVIVAPSESLSDLFLVLCETHGLDSLQGFLCRVTHLSRGNARGGCGQRRGIIIIAKGKGGADNGEEERGGRGEEGEWWRGEMVEIRKGGGREKGGTGGGGERGRREGKRGGREGQPSTLLSALTPF